MSKTICLADETLGLSSASYLALAYHVEESLGGQIAIDTTAWLINGLSRLNTDDPMDEETAENISQLILWSTQYPNQRWRVY